MEAFSLIFVTLAVLGVILLVLAIIAVVVLLPPVRRALAERRISGEGEPSAQGVEHDDRGGS